MTDEGFQDVDFPICTPITPGWPVMQSQFLVAPSPVTLVFLLPICPLVQRGNLRPPMIITRPSPWCSNHRRFQDMDKNNPVRQLEPVGCLFFIPAHIYKTAAVSLQRRISINANIPWFSPSFQLKDGQIFYSSQLRQLPGAIRPWFGFKLKALRNGSVLTGNSPTKHSRHLPRKRREPNTKHPMICFNFPKPEVNVFRPSSHAKSPNCWSTEPWSCWRMSYAFWETLFSKTFKYQIPEK